MKAPAWLRPRRAAVAPGPPSAPAAADAGRPQAWAQSQARFWAARVGGGGPAAYAAELERLNAARHDVFVFDVADGAVGVREKHAHHPVAFNRRIEHFRAYLYRDLLRRAAPRLPPGLAVSVAVAVGDVAGGADPSTPLFAYQRRRDEPWLLLPDVEMLEFGYYEEETPDLSPQGKLNTVVFSGSSTGRPLDEEAVRADASERLRFAARFLGHPDVEFTIGRASECTTAEARALLEAKPYFRMVEWHEQARRRYVLSMDGNGATCSRVVRTLRSRSCLIKQDSDNVLFYFPGLQPWTHYVPVADDAELERLVPQLVRPDYPSAAICDAANAFCRDTLSREAVVGYTAELLRGFGEAYLARL